MAHRQGGLGGEESREEEQVKEKESNNIHHHWFDSHRKRKNKNNTLLQGSRKTTTDLIKGQGQAPQKAERKNKRKTNTAGRLYEWTQGGGEERKAERNVIAICIYLATGEANGWRAVSTS